MLNYIKLNFKLMTKKKTFIVAFAVMLAIAIAFPFVTYIRYMKNFEFNMPAANSVFMANTFMQCWDYLVVIFPFLVVFPYAMSFYDENKLGVKFYIQTRGDRQGKVFILLFSFIVFEIFSTIDTVLVSMASKGKCYLMTSILNYMSTCTHSQAGKNYIYILLVMLSFVIAEILVVKRKIKEDEL